MLDDKLLYVLLGNRIERLRRMQSPRMSQARLAQILGLTRTSVTNIECGKQKLTLDSLYRVCEVFNVPIAELLPEVAEVTRSSPQSVVVGGQAHDLDAKTASSVERYRPAVPDSE